jgi:decaprenylphospho-beta-D-ribofuranose 2-oxidase
MILTGWGRYPRVDCQVAASRDAPDIIDAVSTSGSLIARGNGRAYGDAALNPRCTVSLTQYNRLLDFDPETGRLTCQAGVLLADILSTFVPRGWFPPVTPGTRFVTVGGMIAADVHGKNHHQVGSFGDHLEGMELAVADGRILHCSRTENEELFRATCGGMGLTGIILKATFRLIPIETAFIRQETLRTRNLEETMALFEESKDWTYSVAWIDCINGDADLGRSIIFRGEHARVEELVHEQRATPLRAGQRREKRVPFDFPPGVLNHCSLALFNHYYYRSARPGTSMVDYDTFFYPLDSVHEWNRIYGPRGFLQLQCVLPKSSSRAGLVVLLNKAREARTGPFLSVLKLLGPGNGLMSFPMEGYTLALDFPAGKTNFALMTQLIEIVAEHGGRIYLAKDACAQPQQVRRGYPNLSRFQALRAQVDPGGKFSSVQSQRLGL